jgi:hypothetical protein
MALPRPVLFALVGLVLVVGAYFATSSSRQASDDSPPPVAENVEPAPGADQVPADATKQDSVAVDPQSAGGAEKEANLRQANGQSDVKGDAKADAPGARKQEAASEQESAPAGERARKQETRAEAKPDRDRAERVSRETAPTGPAARLDRALRRNAVVVLFFRQRGADDAATADAVASVRGRKGVGVMTLPITKAPRYSAALGGVTVTRAPTVVVLARKRRPALIEGYIDSASLAQAVSDARR